MSDQMPDTVKITLQIEMIRQARGEVARATGRRYAHLEQACEGMDHQALQDLIRLIRNLQSNVTSERNKRRRGQFWG